MIHLHFKLHVQVWPDIQASMLDNQKGRLILWSHNMQGNRSIYNISSSQTVWKKLLLNFFFEFSFLYYIIRWKVWRSYLWLNVPITYVIPLICKQFGIEFKNKLNFDLWDLARWTTALHTFCMIHTLTSWTCTTIWVGKLWWCHKMLARFQDGHGSLERREEAQPAELIAPPTSSQRIAHMQPWTDTYLNISSLSLRSKQCQL